VAKVAFVGSRCELVLTRKCRPGKLFVATDCRLRTLWES
jgi:hypothetical protein